MAIELGKWFTWGRMAFAAVVGVAWFATFVAGQVAGANSLEPRVAELEKRTEAFGEHDSRTRSSKYNLTVMRARRDNNEQDLLDLLVEYTNEFGPEHPHTIGVWRHIAAMFERNGLLEEALETWREVELKLTDAFGEVALPTLTATRRRLMVQQALGDNQVTQQLEIVGNTIQRISGQDI